MNAYQIVKVYFSRRAERIDQAWLDRRFNFFAQNTLKSLRAQTRSHKIWFCCDAGMQDMVAGLRRACPDGVCTFGEHYGVHVPPCDYVYVTRIDSDDLYAKDALACVLDKQPMKAGEVEASIFRRGYMHDVVDGKLGVYFNRSSPFHTIMFPREVFVDPAKHAEVQSRVGDHSKVASALPVQGLPDFKFCVLVHGDNWLSTFSYGAEPQTWVPRVFGRDDFVAQPVVFDVDDFCDDWNSLKDLFELKEAYPNFKCTLFAIPGRTSEGLIKQVKHYPWIELAAHGICHDPDDEMLHVSAETLTEHLTSLNADWARVFRPPGWHLSPAVFQACNDAGYAMAIHARDREAGKQCRHGCYTCDERLPFWHAHTHDVCDNWIRKDLAALKAKWPKEQVFAFVSEAVLVPQ